MVDFQRGNCYFVEFLPLRNFAVRKFCRIKVLSDEKFVIWETHRTEFSWYIHKRCKFIHFLLAVYLNLSVKWCIFQLPYKKISEKCHEIQHFVINHATAFSMFGQACSALSVCLECGSLFFVGCVRSEISRTFVTSIEKYQEYLLSLKPKVR